jgi:hypothetical protein
MPIPGHKMREHNVSHNVVSQELFPLKIVGLTPWGMELTLLVHHYKLLPVQTSARPRKQMFHLGIYQSNVATA